ncbi:MAG: aromatic amino acid lyase [Gammaproteobacteria bacterium]|nr:aromatic amino acid lyase [Gammaproteobacteria bacterium]
MSDLTFQKSIQNHPDRTTGTDEIIIGRGCKLTISDAKKLFHNNPRVNLSVESKNEMQRSYDFLKGYIDQRLPIYGINTHFGDQVNLLDPNLAPQNTTEKYGESINQRQLNLIKSHACGLGSILSPDIVKTAMLLRGHCLSQGFSGATPQVVTAIINFINHDIVPIVRCYGSIGASGDLIPLAMIAAAMVGEEVDVLYQGKLMKAPLALKMAGLQKFQPEGRDGLALINGTSLMTAIASLAVYDLHRIFKQALSAIAMALESMLVIESAYHPLVHQLKQQQGEILVNDFLLAFWKGSQLLTDLDELRQSNLTHLTQNDSKPARAVQDFYSLRSVAQGFGPFHENLERATTWIENEMNSVNDNPIVDYVTQKIHHNANFMGYYVTDACDILKMNISQASTWLHALLANLVHPRKSQHLPANLVEDPGTQNGFRPLQLLAASLAVQNRKLAQVHQSYMLPTEGDNQDVNSLGTHAALDLKESTANFERLTAILLLAACQALEFRGLEKSSPRAKEIHSVMREHFAPVTSCRPLSDEIENIVSVLQSDII